MGENPLGKDGMDLASVMNEHTNKRSEEVGKLQSQLTEARDEIERLKKDRDKYSRAFGDGIIAAALNKSISYGIELGYASRTPMGDAFESGYLYPEAQFKQTAKLQSQLTEAQERIAELERLVFALDEDIVGSEMWCKTYNDLRLYAALDLVSLKFSKK